MNIIFIFNGILLIAFGLGITLSQMIGDKLCSGFYFIGFGFLLLILNLFIKERKKK